MCLTGRKGEEYGIIIRGVLSTLLFVAAVGDMRTGRIRNRLILTGLGIGLFYQIWEEGLFGIIIFLVQVTIPVIILFLLFLMRVLGAGDIKLFSIIYGICGLQEGMTCIAIAFVIGAAFSVVRMIRQKNLNVRLIGFGIYIRTVFTERSLFPYPYGAREKENTICFSVAILLGYLVSLGVCH